MSDSPFFSVIIPTYNRADFIETALRSVLNQTFPDFEIIVVDDGSTDHTSEKVKAIEDSRIHYVYQENCERGFARNTGTKQARGRYVTFLDSDDRFYPEHLQTAHELVQHGDPEIGHLRYEFIQQDGKITRQMPVMSGTINRLLIEGNFMSCNAVFLRHDIAQRYLFLEDRTLAGLEDWELWLRIAARYPIVYDNTITSAMTEHDSRSVVQTDPTKLIQRIDFFLLCIEQNSAVKSFCGRDFNKLKASCYTYISLHIALTKRNRGLAIRYLLKGIGASMTTLFQRRTIAILKHLLKP